jgi:hypothetical protein
MSASRPEEASGAFQGIIDLLGELPCEVEIVSAAWGMDSEPGLEPSPASVDLTIAIDEEPAVVRYPLTVDRLGAVVELASQLQDALVESRAAWGVTLPECSAHGHPLVPEVVGNEALWICPSGDQEASRPMLSTGRQT